MIAYFDLATQVVQAAKAKGVMISTAESCTGGMIAASLTDVPGSSVVFDRGYVTYSYASKTGMLDVSAALLEEYGAVSKQVAEQMASGALRNSDADIAISATGVAGPGADGAKAEGLVWIGMATSNGVETREMNYGAIGRDKVRLATVKTCLNWLFAVVSES